ncbi:MAG: Molecular chaperone DnaK, partial [Microbacteriaceae bacterium]|nr:Molecular chaperone DnaK [Microbacteriaceae bacterium]
DKLIKDNDDKLPEDVKSDVQADVDALKSALAGDDETAVKTAFDKLSESQQKLGQAIYSQEQAASAESASEEAPAAAGTEEDIVDAEVVDDEPEESSTGSGQRK